MFNDVQSHQKSGLFVLGDWHRKASVLISTPTDMKLATFTKEQGLEIVDQYSLNQLES